MDAVVMHMRSLSLNVKEYPEVLNTTTEILAYSRFWLVFIFLKSTIFIFQSPWYAPLSIPVCTVHPFPPSC